jgi:hypothetical protein
VRGITAEAICRLCELLECVRQDFFIRLPFNLSGGESMADDDCRVLAQHDAYIACRERTTVELTEIAELARSARWYHAMAEIVFAAGIEFDVSREHAAIFFKKSDQATIMIEMPMTDY